MAFAVIKELASILYIRIAVCYSFEKDGLSIYTLKPFQLGMYPLMKVYLRWDL